MSDKQLQKRAPTSMKEKGQYLLAFGVVASMLLVAGFPVFVIFFFGIFAYFLLRLFSSGSRSETREIFEFYLTANEMLRDDERRWYGFEINQAIRRGEEILERMQPAPPLVHFSLGALQHKIGNHKAAIANLARVVEDPAATEAAFEQASQELLNYVKVLRKIEREPADAPMTSAAVRALERARKIRAKVLLEESRQKFAEPPPLPPLTPAETKGALVETTNGNKYSSYDRVSITEPSGEARITDVVATDDSAHETTNTARKQKKETRDPFVDRQSISEVLHDIYDKNPQ